MNRENSVPLVAITDLLLGIIDNRGKSCPTCTEGFPLIATNCVKHTSIYPTFENIRYISDEVRKSWFRAELMPNDILFVNKGTPGRVCLVPNPVSFCAAQDMIGLRADSSRVYYKYLFAVLRSKFIQEKIGNYHVGIAIPHFKKSDMDNLLIPLPAMSVQEKIGNLYCMLSEKVECNNKIAAELEAMAKTIYDYWFVQFDFPDANGKPYKSSGGKMVWNDELKNEIPDEWETTTIGSITTCLDSRRIPVASRDRNEMTGSIPYYGATGIMGYVSRAIFSGDFVLFAEDGSVMDEKGHPILQRVSGDVWINNHAHVLTPIHGHSCRLLMLMLKDIPVMKIKTGSIQMKVTQDNLNRYPLISIPKPLRALMNDILNPMDRKLLVIEKENRELASLRDFLLPMLINGQVKVMA